jgi:hypothetical protein
VANLPPVSLILVVHLDLWISPRIFETVLMGYSGAGGKLIHEKNQKQKLLWRCPFNGMDIFLLETKGQALQHAWHGFHYSLGCKCNSSGSILASTKTEESEGRQINQRWIKVRKNYVCIPKELTPEEKPESVLLIVRVLKKCKSYKPGFFLTRTEGKLFKPI